MSDVQNSQTLAIDDVYVDGNSRQTKWFAVKEKVNSRFPFNGKSKSSMVSLKEIWGLLMVYLSLWELGLQFEIPSW